MPKSTKLAISKEKSIFDYWSSLEKILFYLKLSKFALSLMRIPSSEAAEERMFWKQRKILTEQRSCTSEPLAFARLVPICQENDE